MPAFPAAKHDKPPSARTGDVAVGARPRWARSSRSADGAVPKEKIAMVVLGLILLLIGLLVGPPVLWTIGLILLVVGLVLNVVPVGGTRRRYY